MTAHEQIRHLAPPNAATYQISVKIPGIGILNFPRTGRLSMAVPPPSDIPAGRYSVFYSDQLGNLLPDAGKVITIDQGVELEQLSMKFNEMARTVHAAAEPEREHSPPPPVTPQSVDLDDGQQETEEYTIGAVDEDNEDEDAGPFDTRPMTLGQEASQARMLRLQMKVQRQEQEFIRGASHTREVGETHQLSSFLRREFVELTRLMSRDIRDQADFISEQRRALITDKERWDAAEQRFRELYQARMTEALVPPPLPDYTPVLGQFLTTAQNLGLAYLAGKRPAGEGPKGLAADSGAQIAKAPGEETVQTAVIAPAPLPQEPPAPPTPPEAPAGDPRLLKAAKDLLSKLSDAEIAFAAANPQLFLNNLTAALSTARPAGTPDLRKG